MSDLHARDSERDDWDGPVVELVEDGSIVGQAFVDAGELLVEFYADADGGLPLLAVPDLQRVLDTVTVMLGPDNEPLLDEASPTAGQDPIELLAQGFDAEAAHRGPEDEGFFPLSVAARIVGACEQLDLAVTRVEAFDLVGGDVQAIPGHSGDLAKAHAGEPWAVFRAGCNVQAHAVMERWPNRTSLVVAIEITDRSSEEYVL